MMLVYKSNQSSDRPFRKFKALKNTFKPLKYCYNAAISKHFTTPTVYNCTTSGTIVSAELWISGFNTNLVHTLRSFCF